MRHTPSTPAGQIFSIVQGFWQARAIAVATELRLPDLLVDVPLHVDELATRTDANAAALFRLLRALESIGFFTQVRPRVFANTAQSECLRKEASGSQWAMVLHCLSRGNGPYEAWDELEYSVRSGQPALEKIHGHDYWELLRHNRQANAAVNGSMRAVSLSLTPAVTAAYEWSRFPVIVDVGGGIGTQLVSILDAAPASRGILFDQPHLRTESIPHQRLQIISGDFFESVPGDADAYLLRWVLHDWSDAQSVEILESVRRSSKPTARLILVEHVIAQGPEFDVGKWTDLQMMVCLQGRERTETEYRSILAAAGFELQEVTATASPLSLLVARPV